MITKKSRRQRSTLSPAARARKWSFHLLQFFNGVFIGLRPTPDGENRRIGAGIVSDLVWFFNQPNWLRIAKMPSTAVRLSRPHFATGLPLVGQAFSPPNHSRAATLPTYEVFSPLVLSKNIGARHALLSAKPDTSLNQARPERKKENNDFSTNQRHLFDGSAEFEH
jgi:hypothetical protein